MPPPSPTRAMSGCVPARPAKCCCLIWPDIRRGLAGLVLGLVLAPPAQAGTQQFYIWNRVWSPAVRAGLAAFTPETEAWRVLVAESDAKGVLHPVAVDWPALAA